MGTNLRSLGIAALNLDIAGVARPASGAWDVGAFQFSAATGVAAPTSLALVVQ